MVSIEGENKRGVTWCVVEEVESGDWGSVAMLSLPLTCTLWHEGKLLNRDIAHQVTVRLNRRWRLGRTVDFGCSANVSLSGRF